MPVFNFFESSRMARYVKIVPKVCGAHCAYRASVMLGACVHPYKVTSSDVSLDCSGNPSSCAGNTAVPGCEPSHCIDET